VNLSFQRIPCIFPGADSSPESHSLPVTLIQQFFCLTGSACFIVSATVKYDFLVRGQRRELCPKVVQRNGPLQMIVLEFFIIIICTNQQSGSGGYFPSSVFDRYSNRFRHLMASFEI
jgi:hypothetical protein